MRLVRSLTILAGSCLFALPMMADTTYTYTGNPFGGSWPSPYTATDYVSGSFTLDEPMGSNGSFSTNPVNPGSVPPSALISFTFTDGHNTTNDGNSIGVSIIANTDASGNIVQWQINVYGADSLIYTSTLYPVYGDGAWYGQPISGNPHAANSSIGTWDVSNTSTTPEPSSLVLLGTGILGAIGVGRRRLFSR